MSLPGPVLAIVGPTASGKSSLADEVASRLGSEVVSVDSMQVYRGMDIGTAKTPAGERRCPLRMVDVCDATSDYSVQIFQRDARAVVDGLLRDGKVPVLCGGTGLYLDSVIDEMDFPSGSKGEDARSAYERLADEIGAEALHAMLAGRDAQSAALIHPNNVRRVVRALEMLDEGNSYAAQHEGLKSRAAHYSTSIWAISVERETLYRRIDARVDEMMAEGLLDEVKGLVERGLTTQTTSGQAIGYKELIDFIEGTVSLEDAVSTIKARTRRYAKRQLSWLRRDGRALWLDMEHLSLGEAADAVIGSLSADGFGPLPRGGQA